MNAVLYHLLSAVRHAAHAISARTRALLAIAINKVSVILGTKPDSAYRFWQAQ